MMYKRLLYTALLCLFTFTLAAQEWRVGVQGGISYVVHKNLPTLFTPAAEINIDRSFGKRFHLQSGLRYTASKYEFILGTSFGLRGQIMPAYVSFRHLQLPISLRYRILGNKFRWKAGIGLAPDMIFSSSEEIPTGTGDYIISGGPYKELGLALSLNLADLEYSVSDKLSIGLDFDYQYYIMYSHRLFENSPRQTLFLTSSYRLNN